MSFRKLPGNIGLVYVPECSGGKKKHPCPDCFSCQRCGNERCRVCKEKPSRTGKKKWNSKQEK